MLAVLFSIGDARCGLDSAVVERIVPALPLSAVAGGPVAFAGTFTYHGVSVPVVDLVRLAAGRATQPHLSSRIILTRHADGGGQSRLIGLLAERVTEVRPFVGPTPHNSPDAYRVVTLPELVPPEFFAQLPNAEAAPAS